MKRFIYLFLVTLILGSCGTDAVNDKVTQDTSSLPREENIAETEIKDSLPDGLDFQGETLNLFIRGDEGDAMYEFCTEEENGDIINDAVYRRNRTVEERLNIKINVMLSPGWQDYNRTLNMIRSSIFADDNAYDVIAGWSIRMPSIAVEKLFANMHDIPYIELSNPWWNQQLINEVTIAGNLPFIAGDANLSLLGSSYVMYFDEKLRREYDLPNLYDVVFEGKWIIDYMHNLVKDIYQDLNGDGIMDANDLYGAVIGKGNDADAFIPSSNIRFTSTDADGFPALNIDQERLAKLVDKVYNFYYENSGMSVATHAGNDTVEDRFRSGLAFLTPGYVLSSNLYFRGRDDFGIIPYPKLDENQDKYYTYVQNGFSLLCVPHNCAHTEMVGAFLEAASSESYKNLSPVYFDTAMKVKYARDETSQVMLDIIRAGININFVSVYNSNIGNPAYVMRDLMSAKSNNFASWYAQNETKISLAIEKLIGQMLETN
ncbi:MAG: hypothetical protein FWF15_05330 [Oscillospiraceae bacterium]|nr:hypothetical protein [Oscillospiraceae bacterium]